jgi:heme oxygenase (biliverdin-IX-beta and delta-forming)
LKSLFVVPPVPGPGPAGPLTALRAATRAHHDRIDRLMDLPCLRDRAHYARVLQVFDAFLSAWEPAVAAALPASRHPWLQARSRRPFLACDLRALGIRSLDEAAPFPALPSAAAAWGSLYVLEGSALGGQVITRNLAQAGLHPSNGAAYFHGWGAATAGLWREFRDLLAAELAHPQALDEACDAARNTFDTLTQLLESALHERTSAA